MKTLTRMIITTILLGLTITNVEAAPKKFKNCAAMQAVYPSGVAKPGAVDKQGKAKGTPEVNAKLYAANKHLDRDKDGWACEV